MIDIIYHVLFIDRKFVEGVIDNTWIGNEVLVSEALSRRSANMLRMQFNNLTQNEISQGREEPPKLVSTIHS